MRTFPCSYYSTLVYELELAYFAWELEQMSGMARQLWEYQRKEAFIGVMEELLDLSLSASQHLHFFAYAH